MKPEMFEKGIAIGFTFILTLLVVNVIISLKATLTDLEGTLLVTFFVATFLAFALIILVFVLTQRSFKQHYESEKQIRVYSTQLRNLAEKLQWVQEEEKIRLAREIHDSLGQELTGMKIDLLWMENQLSKNRGKNMPFLTKVRSMLGLVDSMVHVAHRISTELRPALLDQLGLPAALESQSEEFEERSGIQCRLNVSLREDFQLGKEKTTALFRIFQEIMTNILRHAEATRVEVNLKESNGFILLEVWDNGRGIADQKIFDPQSLGLLGIRERAFLVAGEVEVKGISGMGTRVAIRVPRENQT